MAALAGAHAASSRARDRVLALPLYEEFVGALRRRLRALPEEEEEEEVEAGEGDEVRRVVLMIYIYYEYFKVVL